MAAWRDTQDEAHSVSTSAAVMSNGLAIFNIVGTIRIVALISDCDATGTPAATTLQYQAAPTVGAAAAFSGTTGSLASMVAGSSIALADGQATAPSTVVSGANNNNTYPLGVPISDGQIKLVIGTGPTTGTWHHHLRYEPLSIGSYATAAF